MMLTSHPLAVCDCVVVSLQARRRTATPQELLYPMSANNRSESLGSVLEASEADRTFIIVDDDLGEAASCVSVDGCKTASKSLEKAQRLLMPPPKSFPPRPSGFRHVLFFVMRHCWECGCPHVCTMILV